MDSRRDRLLVAGLVAAILLLALLSGAEEDPARTDLRPSSFHTSPSGTRALYLVLEALELPVDHRFTPYVQADSLAGPLALLAPSDPPTPAELGALARWIRGGGVLIYAATPDDPTLDTLGLALTPLVPGSAGLRERSEWRGVAARPVAHRWTSGVAAVPGFRRAFADSSRALRAPSASPLLVGADGEVVAVELPLGRGRVIALADPLPLGNRSLRGSGAALLLSRAASEALARGGTLWFDEYHHGYRGGGSAAGATLRWLRGTPPGHATLQLTAVGLGLLLLLGRRFGAPLPLAAARRRDPLEHVEALASVYRLAGARATARGLLLAGLARRLRRGERAPDGEEFLERLSAQLPTGRTAARELLEEWRKGGDADLVTLARGIDRVLMETHR